jgi:predicted ATPase with chaperone activity
MSTGPLDAAAQLEQLLQGLATLAEPTDAEVPAPVQSSSPLRPALARDGELTGIASADAIPAAANRFLPAAPRTLEETGVRQTEIESIILRLLRLRGTATGMEIAQHIGLPFPLAEKVLHELKTERLLVFRNAARLGDYLYEITDLGLERAAHLSAQCSYCGAVPVALEDYIKSVAVQSLSHMRPSAESVRRALADLTVSREMIARLGRAIASGWGLFLHGAPGNGKTSIAERITAVFGTSIWIPRAISVWGEIVRVFDPSCHEELPLAKGEQLIDDEQLDHRWVRIRRPTIVVGGELTMDSLEITLNKDTGVAEAPLQMKSNCGTLVIDDFGRQRISPQKLLNRWIVPLEERHDYLCVPSGRKIRVPFDQFIVFSTNLEPKDLVDEAFLRRIPYKIEIKDPTQEQFRDLFEETCQRQEIAFDAASLDHLLAQHYGTNGRPMRFCHPRDLVHQISIFCRFRGLPPAVSPQAVDAAAMDYFSVMGS